MNAYLIDPAATLDYTWDWSAWLGNGETITTATVTATSGVTVSSSSHTTTALTAWVTGGVLGTSPVLVGTITTSAGRTDARRIYLQVADR